MSEASQTINGQKTFTSSINLTCPAVYGVDGVVVVGPRKTGYSTGPWTGTSNKGTAYNTATITLEQLAERVKALQTDLQLHGLIDF